ncbi:MAG: rRNA maturation RNase YbeY [Flavobacteriales bacterium]|nr:rRNA maturation RNase YbeY [Flavobacteriales bacterium]
MYFNDLDSSCRIKNRKGVREWISSVILSNGKKLGNIGVIICSDDYLLDLNNQYLDHNYYTDILTFDYTEKDVIGGDLFISYDRVKENAKLEGVLIQHELRRVMVHGVLHLLGLRDKTETEVKKMRAAENVALKVFYVEHSK